MAIYEKDQATFTALPCYARVSDYAAKQSAIQANKTLPLYIV